MWSARRTALAFVIIRLQALGACQPGSPNPNPIRSVRQAIWIQFLTLPSFFNVSRIFDRDRDRAESRYQNIPSFVRPFMLISVLCMNKQ